MDGYKHLIKARDFLKQAVEYMTEAHELSTKDLMGYGGSIAADRIKHSNIVRARHLCADAGSQIDLSKKWIQQLPPVEYYEIGRIVVVTDIFTDKVYNEYSLKTQLERNLRRVRSFYEQCEKACKWVEKVLQNIKNDYDSACKEYHACRSRLVEERRKIMEQLMRTRGILEEAPPAATAEYLPYKSISPHETDKNGAYVPKID